MKVTALPFCGTQQSAEVGWLWTWRCPRAVPSDVHTYSSFTESFHLHLIEKCCGCSRPDEALTSTLNLGKVGDTIKCGGGGENWVAILPWHNAAAFLFSHLLASHIPASGCKGRVIYTFLCIPDSAVTPPHQPPHRPQSIRLRSSTGEPWPSHMGHLFCAPRWATPVYDPYHLLPCFAICSYLIFCPHWFLN